MNEKRKKVGLFIYDKGLRDAFKIKAMQSHMSMYEALEAVIEITITQDGPIIKLPFGFDRDKLKR